MALTIEYTVLRKKLLEIHSAIGFSLLSSPLSIFLKTGGRLYTQVCENLIYPTGWETIVSTVERHTVQLIGFPAWRTGDLECPPFLVALGLAGESLADSPALD